jgi:PAS domain S-box-containing protein
MTHTDLEYLSSAFDENVIFTRTNLKGIITHTSKAFCEISGYSYSELIGSSHNIVRHPDTTKETFEEMWGSLAKYRKWSGEIKNRKKDGGFYWVLANIESEYDSDDRHIGYHAVRHDITAQKEVEILRDELEQFNTHLEEQVNEKIIEVIQLNKAINDTQKEIIFTMGTIGESRSKETGFHVKRVAEYSKLLALHAGIHEYEADMIKQASPMHDIGKIGIPDAILNKPGRLTDEERVVMNTHAKLGFEMLNHSDKELLRMSAIVAHEHHEKWDGSGYPRGLKGEDIHIYGRITAIADVFDALGSDRAYKKAWDDERIWKLFKDESAKHFDPTLIEIFFNHIDDFLEIRDRFKENIISET